MMVDLFERHNDGKLAMPNACGLHNGTAGGWITLAWGGATVKIHFGDWQKAEELLSGLHRQLDSLVDQLDRPETNRTERDEQPDEMIDLATAARPTVKYTCPHCKSKVDGVDNHRGTVCEICGRVLIDAAQA